MSRNNVRGPTSALTEFLREAGITPTTIARRTATQGQSGPTAGPSGLRNGVSAENDAEDDDEETAIPSPRRRTRANHDAGFASDDLDEPSEEPPSNKKRKLSKAAQAKLKATAKQKAKKNGELDNSDDEEEDAYTALSKSMWTNIPSAKKSIGSFEECAECEKQFTVTKYTVAAKKGPGFLCHKCAKASGTDPFKKPTVPKKRKAPADKRTVVNFEDKRFPSLASLCIQIISRHIDDVEALGDIGTINMSEISKAISKNRSLTVENAHLFYDVRNTQLTLYDATKLTAPAFCTLAHLNPNLTSLRLDFCGCLDDTVMTTWCTSLPNLKRLELLGPFLVRVPAWKAFFESHKKIEAFLITQSPRFDEECMKSLVGNCQNIKHLRLKEVGKLDDSFLPHLKRLKGLTSLDLADPTDSMSEDALVKLMSVVGPTLTHLDLSKHSLITDAFLIDGLKAHTRSLTSLSLAHLPALTDEGVAKFFATWSDVGARKKPNPPLVSLDISRNHLLAGAALTAILKHSNSALHHLNINGWNSTPEDSLHEIAKRAKDVRSLDLGWCRELDDFVMKELLSECLRLKEVKVWGCNRLTVNCCRKRGVSIFGVEAQRAH